MSFTTPDAPVLDDESEEFQRHLAEFLETNAPEDGAPVGTALGSVEDTSPQLPDPTPEPTEGEGDGSPGSPQGSEEGGVASSPGSTPPPPPLPPPADDPLPPAAEDEGDTLTFAIGDETEVITDGAPAPTQDPEPTPTSETPGVDYDRIFRAYFPETEVTAANVVELLDFGTRVQSLSPERQRILNAAFAEDPAAYLGDLIPRTPASTPPTTPPPAQVRRVQREDEWGNVETIEVPVEPDPHVAALEARLAQMETYAQEQARIAQEQAMQREADLAGAGLEDFKAKYPSLDDTDIALLHAQAVQKGLYPAIARANNNDPRVAYATTLETAMLMNPVYKDHALRSPSAPAVPPTPEEQTRAALASAVSASTSSPLSHVEPPKVAQTDAEMKQQIAAELQQIVDANQ